MYDPTFMNHVAFHVDYESTYTHDEQAQAEVGQRELYEHLMEEQSHDNEIYSTPGWHAHPHLSRNGRGEGGGRG